MKNYLFLCFLCVSFLSIGQVQEQNPNKKIEPQGNQIESPSNKIESQPISKIGKINKRIEKPRTIIVNVEEEKKDK